MWPVRVSFSVPDAKSQILIVRSADPVTNHWFVGSTVGGVRSLGRQVALRCQRRPHSDADADGSRCWPTLSFEPGHLREQAASVPYRGITAEDVEH